MNYEIVLPLISKALGRDLTPEVQLFTRAKNAIGASLNEKGQVFLTQNWRGAVQFMETPEGQAAIVAFMEAWVKSLVPTTLAKEPTPPPVPAGLPSEGFAAGM